MLPAMNRSESIFRSHAELSNNIEYLFTVIRNVFMLNFVLVSAEISFKSYDDDNTVTISLNPIRKSYFGPFPQEIMTLSYLTRDLSLKFPVTPSSLHLIPLPEPPYLFVFSYVLNLTSISHLLHSIYPLFSPNRSHAALCSR